MKDLQNKYSDGEGHFYFLLLFLMVIVIAVISFFARPVKSVTDNTFEIQAALIDSLNYGNTIYFDFGKSELKPEAFALLDELAVKLKNSQDAKVEIAGYTDDVGSEGFNLELSLRRAEAVKEYLVSLGCTPGQILTSGKGKNEPVSENTNEYMRAMNRRVVFKLFNTESTVVKGEEDYINTSVKQISRTEIESEVSLRDTAGEPVTGVTEDAVSAVLKWQVNSEVDSTEGSVHMIPIDEKKKLAFTIVLDYSGSMFGDSASFMIKHNFKSSKVLKMEDGVNGFISSMQSNMFMKIIKFGNSIDVVTPFTKSKEIMAKGVELRSIPRDGTALLKAIHVALADTMYDSNPAIIKTVIVFTDGIDNASGKINKDSIYRYSDNKVIKVYTIGLLEKLLDKQTTDEERKKGEADLKEISGRTGGFFYLARQASELKAIYGQIFRQILNSYKLSIKWNSANLPPKGTNVTAVINVNVKGSIRTITKNYVME